MQITIDADELVSLKNDLQRLHRENRDLKDEVNQFSEKEINKRIRSEAWTLFEYYMTAVFNKLGFGNKPGSGSWWGGSVRVQDDYFLRRLGEEWYKSEKLTVGLNAEVSDKFKQAYIKLGVKVDDDEK